MWFRLIDKQGFISPCVHIQSDEDEFMEVVEEWKRSVWKLLKDNPQLDGTPLGRLDAGTCMFDLIRYLGDHYVAEDYYEYNHVWACLALEDQPTKKENRHYIEDYGNVLVEVKTYE